jgi:nicotinamide-nucleotide amidase
MTAFHTRAAILSIGDEIVIGQSLDTNSKWLADRLLQVGVTTVEHVTIGDSLDDTADALRRLASRADIIISTGGLGPTLDDLTRQALAKVLGEELIIDHTALDAITARFEARGRKMSDAQKIQACRPVSARMIPNANGTAPGLRATIADDAGHAADVFCLPGPPGEMKPMFEAFVAPLFRIDPARLVLTRFVHLTGIGEGDAGVKLGDLMDRSRNPLVGITASGGMLTCRIRYEGALARADAEKELDATVSSIRARLGDYVYGEGTDTLMGCLLCEMKSQSRTLATVESCTAGMLGSTFTETPGCSAVYLGGFQTYSNDLKQSLVGVAAADLESHGAVSEPVARAMAVGGLERTGATNALAITGVAGPDGGTEAKPVGTFYVAHAWKTPVGEVRLDVRRFFAPGQREEIRRRAVTAAMQMLRLALVKDDSSSQRLLWEVVDTRK